MTNIFLKKGNVMVRRIDKDRGKFLKLIKDKIRQDLKKYIRPDSIILPGKGGKEPIKIKFPVIILPRIKYGPNFGGIGAGKGKRGQNLGPIDGEPQYGEKQAGTDPGQIIEVEFTEEEFYELIRGALPNLQPKGKHNIESKEAKYVSQRIVGPQSLILKRSTLKRALLRIIASGEYNPEDPKIVPIPEDKRYRDTKIVKKPQNNALIAFMRDISGSVSEEEKTIIDYTCFLVELCLRKTYDDIATIFIVHHTEAEEVEDKQRFLTIESSGGTIASSAHKLLIKILEERFPEEQWNIYPIYFSDGFNWEEDNEKVLKLLREKIIPISNQYAYGEVEPSWRSWYSSSGTPGFSEPGRFGRILANQFSSEKRVVYLSLKTKDDAWEAFKKFFGIKQ